MPDELHTKPICIQTDHGKVHVSNDFSIEKHLAIPGFLRIKDNSDGKIYWFNTNAVSWIGPRNE
jgi:hypothetical protein